MKGKWRPGERLEALRLADDFGVSMTPVRDCLNRLVGEGLVEMRHGDGYHVPRITEKMLRDMLDLNEMLLECAFKRQVNSSSVQKTEYLVADYAGRVSTVFDAIAARSANIALMDMLRSLGNRLHAIRIWEPDIFPDWANELANIEQMLTVDDDALIDGLLAYHQRRRAKIPEIVQLALS